MEEELSFVEDEMHGFQSSKMTTAERAEMLARVRSRPADLALYEQLRSSVRALRSLPHLDAPSSVWDEIEARFDETLESAVADIVPVRPIAPSRSRAFGLNWAIRVRRKLAVTAAAAACLLVAMWGALWLASGDHFGNGAPTPSQRILFVKADPKPSDYRASVAVAEFLTKVTQRYRGVSAEELDAILRAPSADE